VSAVPAGRDVNWSQIWDRVAARVPDRPAIVTAGAELSYGALEERAARLARALSERGIGRGDAVGLFLYNRPEYVEAIYACYKLGAIPANMNFRYHAAELAQLLRLSRPKVLIAPSSLHGETGGALAALQLPPELIEIADGGPAPAAGTGYEEVLGERLAPQPPRSGQDRLYMFTGGTTGRPKAVVWQHGALIDAQLVSLYGTGDGPLPQDLDEMVAYAVEATVPEPRTLPIAPLMHATALFNVMNTLTLGGAVVLLDSPHFDAQQALRAVARHRVSRLIIAGNAVAAPLADELDRAAAAGAPHDVSSVRDILSSGMVWTDDVKAELLHHLDDVLLLDILGASEGGPFAYSFVRSPADLPSRLRLAAGAVVLDAADRELDPQVGGEGVLGYRGAMPDGYLDDSEHPSTTYRRIDGRRYVSPGDWVRLHPGGEIEFLGRDSATVNTGGEKVYPAEVEEELLRHPGVADAAVFGVPDRRWGAVVAAVVARRPDADVSVPELAAFLGDRLAGYKKPRRIAVVDSLHRTPSGKVNLASLRELVAEASVNHQ
jgi:acyl-CoA synthetase (AMP-forming)/AMP-acid ligase II